MYWTLPKIIILNQRFFELIGKYFVFIHRQTLEQFASMEYVLQNYLIYQELDYTNIDEKKLRIFDFLLHEY